MFIPCKSTALTYIALEVMIMAMHSMQPSELCRRFAAILNATPSVI